MTRPAYPDAVELRLVRLPTLEGLASGHDRAPGTHRELVIVRVSDTDGHVGWGECSALNRPTYTAEWARDAYEFLGEPERADPFCDQLLQEFPNQANLKGLCGLALSAWEFP